MLVLTRKLMEKLYIGDNVCVTVVRLEGGQVRLGIDAPREIAVVRAELLEVAKPVPTPAPQVDVDVDGPRPGPPPPLSLRTRPGGARGIDIRRRGPSR
jgi:carbon storage regulator